MITRKAVADAVFTAIDLMPSDIGSAHITGTRLSTSAYLITGGGETYTITVAKVADAGKAWRSRQAAARPR